MSITWENPPTTIYIESKYGSRISPKTAGDDGSHGYPSDQVIRNVRVGLYECGWFRTRGLFDVPCRDFVFILLGPNTGHPQVRRYRVSTWLQAAVPRSNLLAGLPARPFVGEISYPQFVTVLKAPVRWLSRPERILISNLCDYLSFKAARLRAEKYREQTGMSFEAESDDKLETKEART